MIKKYIKKLQKVRTKQERWKNYSYHEKKDEKGHSYDDNEEKRYRILIALQVDFTKKDKAFLEFLFKQELLMHQRSPFQGLCESLTINSYLLSKFKDVSHIPLFIKAKNANFDTHCGYDREFVVSAGLKKCLEYLPQLSETNQKDLKNYIGPDDSEYLLTKKKLKKWRKRMDKMYPSSFDNLSLEEEIDLAYELGDVKIESEKITEWKNQQVKWEEKNLKQLYSYEISRNNLKGQIDVKKQLFPYVEGDWNIASHFQTLSQLYIQKGNFKAAWNNVKKAKPYLRKIPTWWIYGLGRTFFEIGADIIIAESKKDKRQKKVFKWMEESIYKTENLHINLLEKLLKVTEILEQKEQKIYFHNLYTKEKNELDRIIGRKS